MYNYTCSMLGACLKRLLSALSMPFDGLHPLACTEHMIPAEALGDRRQDQVQGPSGGLSLSLAQYWGFVKCTWYPGYH